jgi:uroporphyrinogen decarboxylase
MNGFERITAAMNGRRTDTVPIMLHNFMHAAYEYGISMNQFRSDAKLAAGAFIASVERYGFDGVLVDFDTAVLAEAIGVPTDHPRNEPSRCTRGMLASLEEVDQLKPFNLLEKPRIEIWLETVRLLKNYFGDEILVRGNCDQCPFSLASMVRSITHWMMDLLEPSERQRIFQLLDYCADVTIQFIHLMAETGADILSNGDSPAGPELISPSDYREFAQPYEKRVVEAAHQTGRQYILHICGNTLPILPEMLETEADGLELDYKTDPEEAQRLIGRKATFSGNIDPTGVLTRGTPEDVRKATTELLAVFADNPRFILNAGCAIPAEAPSENIKAMIKTARSATIS